MFGRNADSQSPRYVACKTAPTRGILAHIIHSPIPMSSAKFYFFGQTLLLGALLGAGPAQAQRTGKQPVKQPVKTQISAPPNPRKSAVLAPQPVSPQYSAPQAILGLSLAERMADWLTDLGTAQAQAKATGRPVLVLFTGSDWCKPCIVYEEEVFAHPDFAAYAKNRLVLAHFDFPRQPGNQPTPAQRQRNEAAAAQFNREGDFPLAVVLSPAGKVLAKTGYISGGPAAFEAYLEKVIK